MFRHTNHTHQDFLRFLQAIAGNLNLALKVLPLQQDSQSATVSRLCKIARQKQSYPTHTHTSPLSGCIGFRPFFIN
jgi:hypothetical protein